MRFISGFVAEEEEEWVSKGADSFRVDVEAFKFSKKFTEIFRPNEDEKWMFDARAAMEFSNLFRRMTE